MKDRKSHADKSSKGDGKRVFCPTINNKQHAKTMKTQNPDLLKVKTLPMSRNMLRRFKKLKVADWCKLFELCIDPKDIGKQVAFDLGKTLVIGKRYSNCVAVSFQSI